MPDFYRSLAMLGASLALSAAVANPVAASTLTMGGADIVPSTSLGYCMECGGGRVWQIEEIVDGIKDTTVLDPGFPYNGFAGATGQVGTIRLELVGTFNLDSFLLWNDINIASEGMNTFRLDFFDDSESLLSSTATLIAPTGQLAAGRYDFASTVFGVGRVDLVVLSNLQSPNGARIEIREVEFEAARVSEVPVPGTLGLLGVGLAAISFARNRASKLSQEQRA